MNEKAAGLAPVLRRISIACAATTMAAGLAVLTGWGLDIAALKCLVPGTVTMKANAALGFLLSGGALLLYNLAGPGHKARGAARALAASAALLGLATLSQYVFGWNLGIDQILFTEAPGAVATPIPGRMAPVTAFNFVLCGLALLCFEAEGLIISGQALALFIGLSGLTALAGYAYGMEKLVAFLFFFSYTKIAVNTALTFMALSAGLLFLRPGKGFAAFLTAASPLKAGLLTILAAGFILPVAGHVFVSLFFAGAVWPQAPFHSAIETINACAALLLSWLLFWLLERGELEPDYYFCRRPWPPSGCWKACTPV